jgi:hypothetical protein
MADVILKFSQVSVGSLIQPVNTVLPGGVPSEIKYIKSGVNEAISQDEDRAPSLFWQDEDVILYNPQ